MITFKPINTISSRLNFVKDPIDPECRKGVYLIPCSCGIPYVRETRKSINTHILEHSTDIKHDRLKKSALVEHSNNTKHHMCIDSINLNPCQNRLLFPHKI